MIETPDGQSLPNNELSAQTAWGLEAKTILISWWHGATGSHNGQTVWLHPNHLGAPQAATGQDGQLLWQASYAAFGSARIIQAGASPDRSRFTLNLRLPGQYFDAETGLHYNGHRYYDPRRGEYLTPDPLGTPDGPNPYAYVRYNPLKYIDPQGLILFAFDGTANSVNPPAGDSISNVEKFRQAYDQTVNGDAFYITGIGTTDENMPYAGSLYSGDGFIERVALGFKFLDDYVDANSTSTEALQIDTIAFSRGSAEARAWINQVEAKLTNGLYTTQQGKSRCLEFRFEGLWDTVPHLGWLNGNESKYDFSIPTQVKYAAHAVALNEYRGGAANFDGRSILNAPATSSTPGQTRVELGFVGSHSDIGGGYGTGDLSDAALMWMIEQAKTQGIKFDDQKIQQNGWNTITKPIIHDKSRNLLSPTETPSADDRDFIYGNGTSVKQSAAIIGGNDSAWAQGLVGYYDAGCRVTFAAGMVDMKKYSEWLATQGVNVSYSQPPAGKQCQ